MLREIPAWGHASRAVAIPGSSCFEVYRLRGFAPTRSRDFKTTHAGHMFLSLCPDCISLTSVQFSSVLFVVVVVVVFVFVVVVVVVVPC